MQNWEKWSPLLKEDVDHLVRHKTWGCLEGDDALGTSRSFGTTSSEEGIRADVCRQPACFLGLLLECLCSALDTVSKGGCKEKHTDERPSTRTACKVGIMVNVVEQERRLLNLECVVFFLRISSRLGRSGRLYRGPSGRRVCHGRMRVHAREHVNLLVLLVEQLLELAHLGLQKPHALLQRLGVASREGAPAELVARLALESDIGALRTARADAVAAYLLGATAVACLGNAGLAVGADLDHLHGQDSGHGGGWLSSRAVLAGCVG
jgi:hypothetical protein